MRKKHQPTHRTLEKLNDAIRRQCINELAKSVSKPFETRLWQHLCGVFPDADKRVQAVTSSSLMQEPEANVMQRLEANAKACGTPARLESDQFYQGLADTPTKPTEALAKRLYDGIKQLNTHVTTDEFKNLEYIAEGSYAEHNAEALEIDLDSESVDFLKAINAVLEKHLPKQVLDNYAAALATSRDKKAPSNREKIYRIFYAHTLSSSSRRDEGRNVGSVSSTADCEDPPFSAGDLARFSLIALPWNGKFVSKEESMEKGTTVRDVVDFETRTITQKLSREFEAVNQRRRVRGLPQLRRPPPRRGRKS